MKNKEGHAKIPCDKPPERTPEGLGCACPCGVAENRFPCDGSCYRKRADLPDGGFEALCPHCGIWTSLPEGAALKVTRIFDCAVCGYGKRITEEVK